MEIAGSDVIGGLHDMVTDGLISDPPPRWLANLSTAGTNKLRLGSSGRAERQFDNESMISRATTAWL